MKTVVISLLDSDDDDVIETEVSKSPASPTKVNNTIDLLKEIKRPSENDANPVKDVKRIKPTLISAYVSKPNSNENVDEDEFVDNNNACVDEEQMLPSSTTNVMDNLENPITESFAKLIDVCRQVDPSHDMQKLINKKLLRYYHTVHPDFVNSKGFGKIVTATTTEIQSDPRFVYAKLSNVLEELNIRRKEAKTNEGSTGDARCDYQIKRLNKALYVLKKKIVQFESSEVDLTDETDSLYILSEQYKKRACEIYEKICDITGERKDAHRQMKPITFNGTRYPQFNKAMQSFVNETGTFPDIFDVRRLLDHCNQKYDLKLGRMDIKTICKYLKFVGAPENAFLKTIRIYPTNFPAQDAFIGIGKLLQKRRKTDLYETVSFFAGGSSTDPAKEDRELRAKLDENRKHHSRIDDLINKYASDKSSPIEPNDDDSVDEDLQYAEEAEQGAIVISDDEELI